MSFISFDSHDLNVARVKFSISLSGKGLKWNAKGRTFVTNYDPVIDILCELQASVRNAPRYTNSAL